MDTVAAGKIDVVLFSSGVARRSASHCRRVRSCCHNVSWVLIPPHRIQIGEVCDECAILGCVGAADESHGD
jgi:hypothetical protein